MQYTISAPGQLRHTAQLPASKSISNRALVIHALTGGGVVPQNLSDCDDTGVMISALRDNPYEINIKAGGTAMRFMTALLSVRAGEEHVQFAVYHGAVADRSCAEARADAAVDG